jgi:hypothetical protein
LGTPRLLALGSEREREAAALLCELLLATTAEGGARVSAGASSGASGGGFLGVASSRGRAGRGAAPRDLSDVCTPTNDVE